MFASQAAHATHRRKTSFLHILEGKDASLDHISKARQLTQKTPGGQIKLELRRNM